MLLCMIAVNQTCTGVSRSIVAVNQTCTGVIRSIVAVNQTHTGVIRPIVSDRLNLCKEFDQLSQID